MISLAVYFGVLALSSFGATFTLTWKGYFNHE